MNIIDIDSYSKLIRPKKSWKNLDTHYLELLNDPWYKAIAEINNHINIYTVKFYEIMGIRTMYLPITTGSISSPMGLGSDSSPVNVNIFGVNEYLADSMQFMLEYGCRIFNKGCYYIMPSFRGEDADKRHLCQFYHSEVEIPGTLDCIMKLVEEYIVYLCKNILKSFKDSLKKIVGDISHIENMITKRIKRITFDEAFELLNGDNKYFKTHKEGFKVINESGEKKLISLFDGIVWLTHSDCLSVPFYQAFSNANKKAKNADLLFGIGEVVGAGERHFNGNDVKIALDMHKIDIKDYNWYYRLKNDFPLKTSGAGMGIERFILWLLKHDDIRDCQILPRFNGISIVP